MWYIFKDNQCLVSCDFEPNHEDLETRSEIAFEGDYGLDISEIVLVDGRLRRKPPYVPTPAEQQAAMQKCLTNAVQVYMDVTAQDKGYDNLLSAATYADEPAVSKFQQEGQAFRAWRSQVWGFCYALLDAVMAGERAVPTADELIAELPVLELPE